MKNARVAQSAEAGDFCRASSKRGCSTKSPQYRFESDLGYQYAYLLGLYLGDGYINKQGKYTYKLRITQTEKYTKHIEEHKQALRDVLGCKVGLIRRKGCVEVYGYSNRLPELFPQHGKGSKHERKIILETWQQDIILQNPKQFLRGLIQSDGSRYIRKTPHHEYISYNFTNRSQDIRDMFTWVCSLLNITRISFNGRYSLQIQNKKDVTFLDTFIGPKC